MFLTTAPHHDFRDSINPPVEEENYKLPDEFETEYKGMVYFCWFDEHEGCMMVAKANDENNTPVEGQLKQEIIEHYKF